MGIRTHYRVCRVARDFSTAGSSLSTGAVAGIVVGVLVFVALAVVGVVLAILLTCHFKHRYRRYFKKMENEGAIDNPNYGDVDHAYGPLISQNQTTAVARDYEVPVCSINYSEQQQQQHDFSVQQKPGKPTQQYMNIPHRNNNIITGSSYSGDYSYVYVGRPQYQPVRPQSYDSHFLLSSGESRDLPTFVAAELESHEPTSNYTLLAADRD